MSNPGPQHFQLLDKLWKYIAAYPDKGLYYHTSKPIFHQYVDADYGGDLATRKSTTGYITLFRGSPITWRSTLQKTIALSSCESEYMAIREAIKEQAYLRSIIKELSHLLKDLIGLNIVYTNS